MVYVRVYLSCTRTLARMHITIGATSINKCSYGHRLTWPDLQLHNLLLLLFLRLHFIYFLISYACNSFTSNSYSVQYNSKKKKLFRKHFAQWQLKLSQIAPSECYVHFFIYILLIIIQTTESSTGGHNVGLYTTYIHMMLYTLYDGGWYLVNDYDGSWLMVFLRLIANGALK